MSEAISSGTAVPPPTLVIEAGQAEANYWSDLWRYRELFYFLTWRDLLVRYKQTVVGVAWALIQPAITLLIFSIVGALLSVPTNGIPRPVTIFVALLPWQFFSSSLSSASGSLIGNANLISKIYFPRLIIPISAVAVSLVDFLISAVFLAVLMVYFRVVPDIRFLAVPLFVLIAFGTALGAGLWLTALTVKYRDFRFVLPFIVQFGLYISPVAFTSDIVPARWRALYALNPMVGVIDGFRWALLRGSTPLTLLSMGVSVGTMLVLLVTGISYFRRVEKRFADLI